MPRHLSPQQALEEARIREVRVQQQATVAARAAAAAARIAREGPYRPRVRSEDTIVDDAIEIKRGGGYRKKKRAPKHGPKHKGKGFRIMASQTKKFQEEVTLDLHVLASIGKTREVTVLPTQSHCTQNVTSPHLN